MRKGLPGGRAEPHGTSPEAPSSGLGSIPSPTPGRGQREDQRGPAGAEGHAGGEPQGGGPLPRGGPLHSWGRHLAEPLLPARQLLHEHHHVPVNGSLGAGRGGAAKAGSEGGGAVDAGPPLRRAPPSFPSFQGQFKCHLLLGDSPGLSSTLSFLPVPTTTLSTLYCVNAVINVN